MPTEFLAQEKEKPSENNEFSEGCFSKERGEVQPQLKTLQSADQIFASLYPVCGLERCGASRREHPR